MPDEITVIVHITDEGVSSEIEINNKNISETQIWKLVQGHFSLKAGVGDSAEDLVKYEEQGLDYCKKFPCCSYLKKEGQYINTAPSF